MTPDESLQRTRKLAVADVLPLGASQVYLARVIPDFTECVRVKDSDQVAAVKAA